MADNDIQLRIGGEEIVLRHRYEVLSIVNDILVAIWFIVGSSLFFSADTKTAGTWLFVTGSVQLLLRPVIRLVRHVHVRRAGAGPTDVEYDY